MKHIVAVLLYFVVVAFVPTVVVVGQSPDDYYGDEGGMNEAGGDYYYGQEDQQQQQYMGDYDDSAAEDPNNNLYANYAAHQQEKMMGSAGVGGGGGVGFMKLAAGCAVSWFMGGKYHSNRLSKQLKTKFQKEQKQLYTQYYNDVYKLSEQNAELSSYTESLKDALKQTEAKHEMEAIQRDYDEFKQPDIDGDDRISRAEFNMYVKNYLSNYPGLTEEDYPKFEDFDHDHDGYVSFQEYAQQMALQAQKAELDQMYSTDTKSKEKAKGLQDMYESSVGSSRTKMYR